MEDTFTIHQDWTKPGHATFKCDCGEWELPESEVHSGYASAMIHIRVNHDGNGGVRSLRESF